LPIGPCPVGVGDFAFHNFVVQNRPVQHAPVQDFEAAVQQPKRCVTGGDRHEPRNSRIISAANFSVAQMEEFRAVSPLHVLQPPYNLFEIFFVQSRGSEG